MPRISKSLMQAYQIQDFAFDTCMSLKEALTGADGKMRVGTKDATVIASALKAWDMVAERVRIIRGKGKPAPARREDPQADEPIIRF